MFSYKNKKYAVDSNNFLCDRADWDEDFAEGMARECGILNGLTLDHRQVIRFIRRYFDEHGECPLVYQTCRALGLRSQEFKRLFPTGYLRGACKLAGITYEDRVVDYFGEEAAKRPPRVVRKDKVYRVNVWGFLVDPSEWDRAFASHKARELGQMDALTHEHWKIINYLRSTASKTGRIPTVFEACADNGLEMDDLERLFPTGYHRGAVKIAGLSRRSNLLVE